MTISEVEGVVFALLRVMIAIPGKEGNGDCYTWNKGSDNCF